MRNNILPGKRKSRYKSNVEATIDFLNDRYGNGNITLESLEEFLEQFLEENKDMMDQSTKSISQKVFKEFIKAKIDYYKQPKSERNYDDYRKKTMALEDNFVRLMNGFRSYFDQGKKGNELIYLFASDDIETGKINFTFKTMQSLIHEELDDAKKLYLTGKKGVLNSDTFSTGARISNTSDKQLIDNIGQDRIKNINYFFNKLINDSDDYVPSKNEYVNKLIQAENGSKSILDQISDIIGVRKGSVNQYMGKKKMQSVSKARLVDILASNDRLEKIGQGDWQGVLDSLKKYQTDLIGKQYKADVTQRGNYLAKMMSENVPGVFEGDATKFGDYGQYDVQIKTTFGQSKGVSLIKTQSLMIGWMMFSSPWLLYDTINNNIENDNLNDKEQEIFNNQISSQLDESNGDDSSLDQIYTQIESLLANEGIIE